MQTYQGLEQTLVYLLKPVTTLQRYLQKSKCVFV